MPLKKSAKVCTEAVLSPCHCLVIVGVVVSDVVIVSSAAATLSLLSSLLSSASLVTGCSPGHE